MTGLLYGGGLGQLGAQLITAVRRRRVGVRDHVRVLHGPEDKLQGIRVTRDEETIGLDVPEMGVAAYPDSLHL